MSSIYNQYDKNPYKGTFSEEEWDRGYDEGYFAGLNRLKDTCDSASIAFQNGYYTGYCTGIVTE